MARSGESVAHFNLKRAALLWAQRNRFPLASWEVTVPQSPYRADVAAYRPAESGEDVGITAIFECKQARADFLKDHHHLGDNLARLAELRQRRALLERLLSLHHPSLRRGDSLFPDFETVDLSGISHEGYRSVCREMEQVERRIFGKSKLHRMVKWRCASLLYLVLPADLAALEELPGAWGVLTPPPGWDLCDSAQTCPPLTLLRTPQWIEAERSTRLILLQRLAGRATSLTNEAAGITWEEVRGRAAGSGWRGSGEEAR